MDLENEKIGPAYSAPDSYFKDTESRLFQRLGIQRETPEIAAVEKIESPVTVEAVIPHFDTVGVQKRARKQDPITAKSQGINKEVDALGNVVIPPLTFTTNENPEWVNFGAISEEVSGNGDQIKVVSYGDLLSNPETNTTEQSESQIQTEDKTYVVLDSQTVIEDPIEPIQPAAPIQPTAPITAVDESTITHSNPAIEQDQVTTVETIQEPKVIVHEVPESVGLDELESYLTNKTQPAVSVETPVSSIVEEKPAVDTTPRTEEPVFAKPQEERPISLEAPATAFAPIAGRQHESATPGWLGVAAALAAIVAAYFIWTAIQPPKVDTEQVALQQEEATIPEAPLDEQTPTDTIPDGLQLVEPLILEEMPKYKEPNVYSIIDAEEMPARTKRALQDLEDNGLATFDMEDELFEELDFESL